MSADARIGRPMTQPRLSPPPSDSPPKSEMILDMTRPLTSSMTAALMRTVPTRVWDRSTSLEAEEMTAKVVPNEVAESAAPMMKTSTAPANG